MNNKGSNNMGAMILFLAAFVLFVGAVVMVLRQDDTKGAAALKKATSLETTQTAIDTSFTEIKTLIAAQGNFNKEMRDAVFALTERVKSNEMLADARAKAAHEVAKIPTTKIVQSPIQSIVLKQEKPLELRVIYR
jgi:Tfp pilus assembly protein PilN